MSHSTKRRRVRTARQLCVRYLRAVCPRAVGRQSNRNIQGTLRVIRQWPDTGLELVEFAEQRREMRP